MSDALLSVVVPIYNVEKYLRRCLDSIVNQTYKNLEIILVDDGSPDGCGGICDEYAKKYDAIKVIHKKNAGLGFARNSGLAAATGDYIAFPDSDDYLDVTMYEKLVASARKTSANVVFCGAKSILLNGKVREENNPFDQAVFNTDEVFSEILPNIFGAQTPHTRSGCLGSGVCKSIYATEIFKKYAIRFPSERELISEDIVFDLDYLPKCSRVAIVDQALYFRCENSLSLTNTYRPDRFQKNRILYKVCMEKSSLLENSEAIRQGISLNFLSALRVCIKQAARKDVAIKRADFFRLAREICSDQLVRTANRECLKAAIPIKQKLFSVFIRLKMPVALCFLTKAHTLNQPV
jgi:glycosyltransferase involved in cell wall biosynthesis